MSSVFMVLKKIISLIYIFILFFSFSFYVNADDEVTYSLFTDTSGVRWQYYYQEIDGSSYIGIQFFDKPDDISEIAVPSVQELRNYDSSIPTDVTIQINLENYTDQELGTPKEIGDNIITRLVLMNVNNIYGVSPMINSSVETEVVLSSSGSVIGDSAFSGYMLNLQNLEHVSKIGANAFKNSTFKSTDISLDSLITIGESAFYGTNLTSVSINTSVLSASSFSECKSLV